MLCCDLVCQFTGLVFQNRKVLFIWGLATTIWKRRGGERMVGWKILVLLGIFSEHLSNLLRVASGIFVMFYLSLLYPLFYSTRYSRFVCYRAERQAVCVINRSGVMYGPGKLPKESNGLSPSQ